MAEASSPSQSRGMELEPGPVDTSVLYRQQEHRSNDQELMEDQPLIMESIGKDELQLISNKLTFSPDYTRFRSVCKSWRSSAPKRLQLPWLIECDQLDEKLTFSKFYQFSFETNKLLMISELFGLTPPPSTSSSTNRETDCIGYSHGWMALFDRSTSSVSLFNPVTNSSITLPVLKNLSERWPDKNVTSSSIHFYLTSDPSESLSNCFALVNATFSQRILYCKVGFSDDWLEMPHPDFYEYSNNIHVCSYRGMVYIASHGDVFVCDFGLFGCSQISLRRIISFPGNSDEFDWIEKSYLVESDGDLLLVLHRYFYFEICDRDNFFDFGVVDEGDCFEGYYFQVFKLEFGLPSTKMMLVDNLGNKAFLLSQRTVFSLTASKYPGCKGNSIYHTCNTGALFGRHTPALAIYDFQEKCPVTVDVDDPPLYVDWENCGWFTPSLLK